VCFYCSWFLVGVCFVCVSRRGYLKEKVTCNIRKWTLSSMALLWLYVFNESDGKGISVFFSAMIEPGFLKYSNIGQVYFCFVY